MSLNFGQIPLLTTELAALAGNEDNHNISDVRKLARSDPGLRSYMPLSDWKNPHIDL